MKELSRVRHIRDIRDIRTLTCEAYKGYKGYEKIVVKDMSDSRTFSLAGISGFRIWQTLMGDLNIGVFSLNTNSPCWWRTSS